MNSQNPKPDNTVKVALITTTGAILTTLIAVLIAPIVLREINKTPTPVPATPIVVIESTPVFLPIMEATATFMSTVPEIQNTETPIPQPQSQQVRWGPVDGLDAGICINSCADKFLGWDDLKSEVERKLLPQVGVIPANSTIRLNETGGKKDWIVEIVDASGAVLGNIWFGPDPLNSWAFDGLVRVGTPVNPVAVWATFQRYSDGSYYLR